jgi:hypothetical protein
VWLSHRNIKTNRPSEKLDYRKLGPFQIVSKRGNAAYQLRLPCTMSRLHPVFNVSLLEPYRGSPEHATPALIRLEGESAIEIQTTLDSSQYTKAISPCDFFFLTSRGSLLCRLGLRAWLLLHPRPPHRERSYFIWFALLPSCCLLRLPPMHLLTSPQ